MPTWALTLAYWLHMAATVVWIGGLFFQAAIVAPALTATLEPQAALKLLRSLRQRFSPLAWFSLALLTATGLTQMSGSPHYDGLLQIDNRWSAAILAKHAVIGLMVIAAAIQTWLLQPQLERALLRPETPEASGASATRYQQLTSVNLVLGLVVLALTAIARTA